MEPIQLELNLEGDSILFTLEIITQPPKREYGDTFQFCAAIIFLSEIKPTLGIQIICAVPSREGG
jgi:hypothetical protein